MAGRGNGSQADEAVGSRTTPDAVAPPPGHPRFPLFDSLRAIAALSLLLAHSAGAVGVIGTWYLPALTHLDVSLTLFFLISGFLLYRPFVAGRNGGAKAPRVRDYARRRVLRIVPAYWLALTVLAIFPAVPGVFGGHWWIYYGLLQNYPIYHAGADCAQSIFGACGIATTWSLVVEVSFYAVLPVYAALIGRATAGLSRERWVRRELVLLGALGCASVAVRIWAHAHPTAGYLRFTLLGTFYWFALGMGLAVVSVAQRGREERSPATGLVASRPGLCWLAAIALYALLSATTRGGAVVLQGAFTDTVNHLAFGAIALLLVLPAVFADRAGGLPRRILANPLLSWFGLISYGIFLWHGVIAYKLAHTGFLDLPHGLRYAAVTAATFALSVGCATASYYLVECPIMRFKNRRFTGPRLEIPRPVAGRQP